MKLVVGLGNPGPEYKGTRHNVGFLVAEALARRLRTKKQDYRWQSVLVRAEFKGEPVLVAKPLTYMNLSGRAVSDMVRANRLVPAQVMVVSDDLDLPLGRIRMRAQGGSGGHRGLQSIIDSLGTSAFPRLRVGIGRPEDEDPVDYVLSRFDQGEDEVLEEAVRKAVDAVVAWLALGIERAMNQYN